MGPIRLEDIAEQLPVNPRIKGKFQSYYNEIYDWTVNNYVDRKPFRQSTVNKLNALLYYLTTDGTVPYDWYKAVTNADYTPTIDQKQINKTIAPLYLDVDMINWNTVNQTSQNISKPLEESIPDVGKPDTDISESECEESYIRTTCKEDLFLTVPKYPRIGDISDTYPNIHISLPIIPTKQSEISVTTEVDRMTEDQLLALYPNRLIRTRSSFMYKERKGLTLDPDFGLIIPVDGFTEVQIRDCIIRYPHIFKATRILEDGTYRSFYSDIEIDGELVNILKVWKYLPESRIIDIDSLGSKEEQIEFIKEYAIRRYLLERDIKHINHKHKIRGVLPEYMTLIMPPSMYQREGIKDPIQLARKCVIGRVSYLHSRNPRIVGPTPTVSECPFDSFCCEQVCDRSCTRWAQFDYLMMRNRLTLQDRPFQLREQSISKYVELYENTGNKTVTVTCSNTINVSEVLTYIAICNNWKGSAMRVRVFHLTFSDYIESLQNSWTSSKSDDLSYMELWSRSCEVLIVSGLDYVNFKDYQCQILLQLIQNREREDKVTFIVCPMLENIMGSGKMFNLLQSKLKQNVRCVR